MKYEVLLRYRNSFGKKKSIIYYWTAMIITAHCESKLVQLTLLCDVGQPN